MRTRPSITYSLAGQYGVDGMVNKVAARAAEKLLRQLRVLLAPAADQALLEAFLLRGKVVIFALRQVSAAASAGDRRRMSLLVRGGGRCDPPPGRARRPPFRALASK